MITAGRPQAEGATDRARRGRLDWLPDLSVVESAEQRGREPDSTPAAAAAHQDARWWRGEFAGIRLALGPGLIASALHAAVQAVPGQLCFLLTDAPAPGAHPLVAGAVDRLPVDISDLAPLWTSQVPGEGAGRLTEPPLDTPGNSEAPEAAGIEGVPFEVPPARGSWSG